MRVDQTLLPTVTPIPFRKRFWRSTRYQLTALAFISPWLIGFLVFMAYPILESLRLSFTDFRLLDASWSYINIKNYVFIFTRDSTFLKAVQNTLLYAILSVPINLGVGLGTALLMNQKVRGLSVWRTMFFLPSLVPPVATIVVFRALFDPGRGLINEILRKMGMVNVPGWFATTDTALITIVLMGIWGFGGTMIIILAGLQDVPRSLLEAAQIDGANTWQKFLNITLPLISPVLFFNLVLGCIGAFQVFAQSIVLGGATGWPGGTTMFFNVYVYLVGFQSPYRIGYASALGWILFIGVLIVTGFNFLVSKRFVFYAGE
jgi:multiple sugar transport system permease protein